MAEGDIRRLFEAQEIDDEDDDDHGKWEVIGPIGTRIATAPDEAAASDLEMRLNMELSDWADEDAENRKTADD